ncbi:MAG: dienelactone hydrolase family protein [Dehalococcoidia bacterium]|nr:dienelactone hydrolase family protein [Dehalococcoidia bacterium]
MTEWRSDTTLDGMRQRVFTASAGTRDVPGVLWTPEGVDGPLPLVLIGHGGAGHKLDDSRLDLAGRYVEAGVAAAAIDGPWHGERAGARPEGWGDAETDAMLLDWRVTLDELVAQPEVDAGRIGYGGVSMGTIFGLPFVASEPRIRAAVLGLAGATPRLVREAGRLGCPVLFLMQWDDELFDRPSVLALFEAIASSDRRLLAFPGGHAEAPEAAREASTRFLIEALSP